MSDNPYQTHSNFDHSAVAPPQQQVKSKVLPPAIALIVSGALSSMGAVWGVVSWALASAGIYPSEQQKAEQVKQFEELFSNNKELGDFFTSMLQFQESPISLLLSILGLILSVVVILGGVKMMGLQSYGLALAAAIINVVSVVPVFSTCCCYGVPIGIWALVVLLSGNVRDAFRAQSSSVRIP